jgi:hypothetical protein
MWQQLLEIALLGTEKKPLDITVLPPDIGEFLTTRHHDDPEAKFLEAAALGYYYRAAGKMPEKFTGEWDDTVIEESRDLAPSSLQDIFSKLETVDYHLRENLLNLWLDVLIEKQYIISPELITKLLSAGNNFSHQTKSKIIQVIGNKGAWVLSYSNELNYKQPVAQDHVWLEGNTSDRKNLFAAWRKSDPSQSIQMLRSTWQEESVVTKKAFLEIIRDSATLSDLSFAEELYENEFKYQPREKKTEKDCRKILADILLKHSETKLFTATAATLVNYLGKSRKKGIVGLVTGKEQTTFMLPETADDGFWNVQTMEQVYGFETKNYDIAIYANVNQLWLALLLEVLPMNFWTGQFDGGHEDVLACFLDHGKFQTTINGNAVPVFLGSFYNNARFHQDTELASLLVKRVTAHASIPLLKYLRQEDYESYVKKNNYYADYDVLLNGPFDHHHSWSLTFSRQLLSHVYEQAIQNNQASLMTGKVIAQFIHRGVYPDVIQHNNRAKDHVNYNTWNKNIFEPVHSALEIRALIDSHKNPTS